MNLINKNYKFAEVIDFLTDEDCLCHFKGYINFLGLRQLRFVGVCQVLKGIIVEILEIVFGAEILCLYLVEKRIDYLVEVVFFFNLEQKLVQDFMGTDGVGQKEVILGLFK